MEYTKKYDKCQRFSLVSKAHLEELISMTTWSFAVWGIDLIDQLPKGRGNILYAVIDVDYFIKWVEAEALASITPAKIREFVYKSNDLTWGNDLLISFRSLGHPPDCS